MHRIGEIKMKIHEKERYMALSVPIGFNDLRVSKVVDVTYHFLPIIA